MEQSDARTPTLYAFSSSRATVEHCLVQLPTFRIA